jgi:membrane-associated phospholipid phosphatase
MKYFYIILCLLSQSISCFSQTDSLAIKKENRFKVAGSVIANSVLSVPGDFSAMGHNISSDWKRTAIYTAGIIGLIAVDKQTTGFWHDTVEPNIDYSLPKIDVIHTNVAWIDGDNAYIIYPIIGLYAGSLIANHKKGQVVAVNAVKAVTYSYVISHLFLKTVFARNRPQRKINDDNPVVAPWTKDPWDFGNFHPVNFQPNSADVDGNAMPSFHATFYFSVAKVFQMEYNNYWIPYTIATGVFLSNIKGHDHWVSDLLVGGLVGTIIGRSIVISSRKQMAKNNSSIYNYDPKKFKMTKQLIPQISNKMIGLHFIGQF